MLFLEKSRAGAPAQPVRDSAGPSRQLRGRQAATGCVPSVDSIRRQTPRFQVHAVANDYDAVEDQARFGAVPRNKLIEGVLVNSVRG
jgi:hypothetical protein